MKRKLEIGYKYTGFEIRRESITINSHSSLSIIYLSDLHFNRWSAKLSTTIVKKVMMESPDLVLFGGDYVDSKQGLPFLKNVFFELGKRFHCFAITGNHDNFFGFSKIKKAVYNSAVKWITNIPSIIKINHLNIEIHTRTNQRCTENIDLRILLLHEPRPIETIHSEYNLVLAGHLHGCQFVFWQKDDKLFPGALFYHLNFLKWQSANTLYLISKGLGDTLPIRYNCKKDMLRIDVNSKKVTR